MSISKGDPVQQTVAFTKGETCAKLCCNAPWGSLGEKKGVVWAKCEKGHYYKWCSTCQKAITAKNWSKPSTHQPSCILGRAVPKKRKMKATKPELTMGTIATTGVDSHEQALSTSQVGLSVVRTAPPQAISSSPPAQQVLPVDMQTQQAQQAQQAQQEQHNKRHCQEAKTAATL
jgi:hypothetical protein